MNSKSMPFKKRENPLATPAQSFSNATVSTRDKYTATMDRELRKRVKIAAVQKGVDFSQFVEEAVIEKLERGGF